MNLIDRYVIKQFVLSLFFSLIALCTIFLIVNLLENLDDFIDHNASFSIIVDYYIHFFPEIIKLIMPMAMLLATLFTIGRMSTKNEINAMKSGGQSIYRLMAPLVALSVVLSFGQLYFNGWLLPKANEVKIDIEVNYLKKGRKGGSVFNLYFRDSPNTNVVMQYYNSKIKTGNRVAIETYSSELKPRLVKRIEAERIIWDSTAARWKLINGIRREYYGAKTAAGRFDTCFADIHISHQQIVQLKRSTKEMNLNEFWDYIIFLRQGGKDVRRLMINYYTECSFPFANFIVILFGVPFASVRRKGGMAIQIGAAMVISFLYIIFTEIAKPIGYSSDMPAVVSGWLANIIFFTAGIITLLKTRT